MSKGKRGKKKSVFSTDERMMVLIYYDEDRRRTIAALKTMRNGTGSDEVELRKYTDSAIRKLEKMTDREFEELEII